MQVGPRPSTSLIRRWPVRSSASRLMLLPFECCITSIYTNNFQQLKVIDHTDPEGCVTARKVIFVLHLARQCFHTSQDDMFPYGKGQN